MLRLGLILILVLAVHSTPDENENVVNVGDSTFCSDKSTGDYADPDKCDGYISCVHGIEYKRICPARLAYNAETASCSGPVCQTGENQPTFCDGKSDGNYKFPQDCRFYVTCSNGIAYRMPCNALGSPVTLHWDDTNKRCETTDVAKCHEDKASAFCTMSSLVYLPGENWVHNCRLKCSCGVTGNEDCRLVCPRRVRPCGQNSVKEFLKVAAEGLPQCFCTKAICNPPPTE